MSFSKIALIGLYALAFSIIISINVSAQEKYEYTLQECINRAVQISGNKAKISLNKERKKAESIYEVKTLYYELLLKKELLKLANEVKDNFQKASDKAEKKLEAEDPEITQQDLLKLKLGLAGAKDEVNGAKYSKMIVIESLKNLIAMPRSKKFAIKDKRLRQEKIKLNKVEDYFKTMPNDGNITEKEFESKIAKIYLRIEETGESVKIAREARKISRSLMVTNLANFDFGIGEAKDLFESLFIYMRSVKNYLKKVRDYNIVVAELAMETRSEIRALQ